MQIKGMFKSLGEFIVVLGALACILVWLDIKPRDFQVLTLPHGMWLAAAVVLFGIGVGSSLRSLYLSEFQVRRLKAERQISKLKIHSAHYGTGPDNDVSVFEILEQLPKDALTLLVSNDVLGCDPAEGKDHKRLEVEYSYGGSRPVTVSRLQGSRLVLPEDSWAKVENQRLARELTEQTDQAKDYRKQYYAENREVQNLRIAIRDVTTLRDEAVGERDALRLECQKLRSETSPTREAESANWPQLLMDYKPRDPAQHKNERLVFINDGTLTITGIEVGPLLWRADRRKEINLHSVLNPLRPQDQVDCYFTAFEQLGNTQRLYSLPDLLREMMGELGPEVQASVDVSYRCLNYKDKGFSRKFVLSIDPYDRIAWDPGSVQCEQCEGPVIG